MDSALSSAYTGAATLGNIKSTINLGVGVVASIILVIVGCVFCLYYMQSSTMVKTNATVVRVNNCTRGYNKNTVNYKCSLVVQYVYNNKQLTATLDVNAGHPYRENDNIVIYVNSSDETQIQQFDNHYEGYAVLSSCCAVFIVLAALLQYYLSHTYKPYAALLGTEMVMKTL